ncbi:MAG: PDZ domain-containing protein [Myxococcota bacterium]
MVNARGLGLGISLLSTTLGCSALESDEARQAAEVTQDVVAKGVDEARVGIEKLGEVAAEAVEEAHRAEQQAHRTSAESLEGAKDAIACEEPGQRCTVTTDFARRARSNGGAVARQLRFRIVKTPALGVRIDGMESGSVAELLGFQVGDVVTHVNGIPVGSSRDTMLLYMNARAARRYVVEYQRDGEAQTLTADVR